MDLSRWFAMFIIINKRTMISYILSLRLWGPWSSVLLAKNIKTTVAATQGNTAPSSQSAVFKGEPTLAVCPRTRNWCTSKTRSLIVTTLQIGSFVGVWTRFKAIKWSLCWDACNKNWSVSFNIKSQICLVNCYYDPWCSSRHANQSQKCILFVHEKCL